MARAGQKPSLSLSVATEADLEELATVFPRSFHPVSEYMRRAQPDTPVMMKWWADVHRYAIQASNVRLWKVTRDDNGEIVALCRWRVYDKDSSEGHEDGDLSAGTWSLIPLSTDHDHELCNPFITFIAESTEQFMGDRPYILIELLLTVHEAKGLGAGKLLVNKLCQEADEKGIECFVETNNAVVSFYEQLGFELKAHLPMPGGYGYEEFVLVRPPK